VSCWGVSVILGWLVCFWCLIFLFSFCVFRFFFLFIVMFDDLCVLRVRSFVILICCFCWLWEVFLLFPSFCRLCCLRFFV